MSHTFTLYLGALSPRIEEQLRGQSLRLGLKPIQRHHLQRDADEISRLLVRGILTSGECDRARKRLCRKIERHLEPIQDTTQLEKPND
jgi:hypothetical protein